MIQTALKPVQKGSIDNKYALEQAMAWPQADDESLIEPRMTQLTDAYLSQDTLTHWPLGNLNEILDM